MINFDEFDMANEGATTHVVPIVAEVPQDIDDADLQANSKLDLAILPLRNVVLFPAPLGPKNPTICPGSISKFKFRMAALCP